MSYVEKNMSYVEKIISDLVFTICKPPKNNKLQSLFAFRFVIDNNIVVLLHNNYRNKPLLCR